MKASYKVFYAAHINEWVCEFHVDGRADTDERGTHGTGCKLYATEEKAIAAGKRYTKKMLERGFIA